VQPNHAWRYTFKTYGHEAGLDDHTLDAICGHSSKSKGGDYTKVSLKKRKEAMASFPRYQIGESADATQLWCPFLGPMRMKRLNAPHTQMLCEKIHPGLLPTRMASETGADPFHFALASRNFFIFGIRLSWSRVSHSHITSTDQPVSRSSSWFFRSLATLPSRFVSQ
jgi:hypothetical protein